MAPLSHPSIRDSWFREVSSQWPGQAMTLKVNKIIHTEKSLFQDVLVFESETYGNVLVLDGVIKCTERDEFAYQEMIAHLPLASHPNPKKVLVVGGGDGGVVREVLKHDTVEQVVLCDIDEAVVRVSKAYLPHMAALLTSPKVTVHIGDGFEFLASQEDTYDVIITDSSDPVGPAAALFKKPYFQLLHGALTSGGHIATQGECQWLHLGLIQELRNITREIFAVSKYAYTTIPTYPSGQIGFIVCAKAPGRDLRTPIREIKDTRYYNKALHASAFVLPEFAKVMLQERRDIRPIFGRNARPLNKPERKVLLLGSGFVARPCAEYVARDPSNRLTIACRTITSAEAVASSLPNTTSISLDVNDTEALEAAVAVHDIVISLVPYTYHAVVIRAAIKGKTHVVTTSYISPAVRDLDQAAKNAGIMVMNEIGFDPGVDHLYAIKTIDEVHEKGGKIKQFSSYSAGLPAPECCDNPLGYKFSWSSRGALLAMLNSASYYSSNQKITIAGPDVMRQAKPYYITPAYAFVAFPNRDSTVFREFYNIPEAETVVRGTLRFQGFPQFIQALNAIGWMDTTQNEWLVSGLTWAQATQKAIGAADASEATLVSHVKKICNFPSEPEADRIISGMRWIGLFSNTPLIPRDANFLDTLCAQLEKIMAYNPGERDLIMLQHKFVIQWADGSEEIRTSTLEAYGAPKGFGHSAMAMNVGVPCGIAAQLILDGVLSEPGIHAPYSKVFCDPLREELEKQGIALIEKVL
ncbi:spermidine synthase [Pholiota conissans]|uniref:Spermidine synthase n=1 Tax=Pholiota conissans TaxID=109636 RepID=A0A9P5YV50_9AGAR|nr:spermidine synthase [Pholiota conissans]